MAPNANGRSCGRHSGFPSADAAQLRIHTQTAVNGRYLMFGLDFFIYIIVAIFYILTTGRLPFSG